MKTSKLCLGTVQLGMLYGVRNAVGRRPTSEECADILDLAAQRGIQYIDTAPGYGTAERILGNSHIGEKPVRIITKLPACTAKSEEDVKDALKSSLMRLEVASVYGYMLHDAKDFYQKEIIHGLLSLKERGWIHNVGVSIYEPEDALKAVQSSCIDIIQIPYNVLDQRLDDTDFFELAKENRVKVFARSAFLQGLLLMEDKEIPKGLSSAKPYLKVFRALAREYGFTSLEAAMLYSYCHPKVNYVVFGVDTISQLRHNLDIVSKAEKFQECYSALRGKFRNVPREVVNPSLWA